MQHKFNLFIIPCIVFMMIFSACNSQTEKTRATGLKDVFEGDFYIGTTLNKDQINGIDTSAIKIVKQHFNSITAENCMKVEKILVSRDVYDFSVADKFVDFGEQKKMFIVGHTLIWHSQTPDWFFTNDAGNDVSKEELIQRMKKYIHKVVGRYKGRVNGWDVVNEAVNDDGSMRESKYYKIIGPEYVRLAFQFAHEADPDAQLYYNDYSMNKKEKQEGVIRLIKSLQEDSIPVDGIGMQAHLLFNEPTVEDMEQGIINLSQLGLPIMITELDITVLPWPGSEITADVATNHEFKKEYDLYPHGLPDSVSEQLNNKYLQLFEMFKKHHDKISRVTVWGIYDQQSWRNYWPIPGRTDYPLLFDRNYQPKPVVKELLENE